LNLKLNLKTYIIERLVDVWVQPKPQASNIQTGKITRQTAGFIKQIWYFFTRSLVQQSRDLFGFYIDNLLVFISGSMLGFTYQNSTYIGPVSMNQILQCPVFIRSACLMPRNDFFVAQGALTCLGLGMTAAACGLRCFGRWEFFGNCKIMS
jgi:hypothetical protein